MSKNLNYNTDLLKHYVRHYGWIAPFKTLLNHVNDEHKKKRRKERCKYLTFCAIQAIDVFLFEKLKYLYRDKETSRLENVYFCENDPEAFTIIKNLIGSSGQGFFGDFKKIVLQDVNAVPTNTSDPFDEPEDVEQREMIRLAKQKEFLLSKFPFDVINLDFYGNFFPNEEGRYSESFQTYIELLKLQKLNNGHDCKRFLMFLTVYTPMFNEARFISNEAITSFESILFENLVHDEFKNIIQKKYGSTDFKVMEVYMKFIWGFTKQVLFKETYKHGWMPSVDDIFTYDRVHPDGRPYKETTFIVEYKRNPSLDSQQDFDGAIFPIVMDQYKKQLFHIVANKPDQVPLVADIPQDVIENLEEVREFRDEFLKKIGIYDPKYFA